MSRRKPYNVQVKLKEGQAQAILDLIEDELREDKYDLELDEQERLAGGKRALKDALRRLDYRLERIGVE